MQSKIKTNGYVLLIPPQDILPNRSQPRTVFDTDALEGLAESIRQNGVLQPLLVRHRSNGLFELVAGERRLRAAKLIGLQRVPCILTDVTDEQSAVYALLENIQRKDLSFFEEAQALFQIMMQYGLSQEDIARMLGRAPSTISNKLRLLRLPEDVRDRIMRTGLTERHARALLKLPTGDDMRKAIAAIERGHMNVAQTDHYIDSLLKQPEPKRKPPIKLFKDVRIFVNTINHAIDTMRHAGIAADAKRQETDDYIEYHIRIPKNTAQSQSSRTART
ncbi:MAG: ParB/RepB/Spo0J family partition protein [Clostridia bacterium]|nr:ParB/RepB/Spo0J family partition protein [Clostridia bacterium]